MYIDNKILSPNFSNRTKNIKYIIIHYTELPLLEALERLCDNNFEVSAHYLIKENGEILQLVEDENIAWHAGISFWHGEEKINESSIGIELDNLGDGDFSRELMKSCVNLCKMLSKKYNLPSANILGHSDIAPDRKIDPGIFFNWFWLAKYNLGKWYKLNENIQDRIIYRHKDQGLEIKALQLKLQYVGYKIKITSIMDLQTNFVIRAFQSHFYPAIIKNKGLKFYRNTKSLYEWNYISDLILNQLLPKAFINNLA